MKSYNYNDRQVGHSLLTNNVHVYDHEKRRKCETLIHQDGLRIWDEIKTSLSALPWLQAHRDSHIL